ncbi:MAG: peptidylprolyl isomerase [Chloroflexi bacterium]|nr:peptidylprolyl isomerase [Chloroflexota bacterium]
MRRLLVAAIGLSLVACQSATGSAGQAPTPRPAATSVLAGGTPTAAGTPAAAGTATCPPPTSGTVSQATITLTSGGVVTFALRADKAPLTVKNFADKSRACFYDGLIFHRVEPNFVIQGGDPLGTGTGGRSNLATEPSDLPFLKGAVGVARGGDPKVSNDAQFFICTGSCRHLDGLYTNFGQVVSGQDVADRVKVGDRIRSIRVQ